MENEKNNLVYLNPNVFEKDKVLGISKRNWGEAFIKTIIIFAFLQSINFVPSVRIVIQVISCITCITINLVGIRHRSIGQILSAELKFRKNRRQLHLRSVAFKRRESDYETEDTDTSIAERIIKKVKQRIHEFVDTYSEN